MDEKECSRCAETKPRKAFGKRKASKDGLQYFCKECSNIYARKWQRDNAEHVSAWGKRYHKDNPEIGRRASKLARERHPEKIKARNVINNAIYRGALEKPTCCENCKKPTESRKLHAHHRDYGKPWDVDWLCHPCHAKLHRRYPD